jgi:hypothetical protein
MNAVSLQNISESASARQAWSSLTDDVTRYWKTAPMAKDQWQRTGEGLFFWKPQTIEVSGIPFDCPVHDGFVRPLVINAKCPSSRFRSAATAKKSIYSAM